MDYALEILRASPQALDRIFETGRSKLKIKGRFGPLNNN